LENSFSIKSQNREKSGFDAISKENSTLSAENNFIK
jgi:hypothetical protein